MTNTNAQGVEAIFRPRHQSFPFFTNAQEAYDYGREIFFEKLEAGDHECNDKEMIKWFKYEMNCIIQDIQVKLFKKESTEDILDELPWDTSFIAGYMSAYIEFAHLGMHHDLVYDGEDDEQGECTSVELPISRAS